MLVKPRARDVKNVTHHLAAGPPRGRVHVPGGHSSPGWQKSRRPAHGGPMRVSFNGGPLSSVLTGLRRIFGLAFRLAHFSASPGSPAPPGSAILQLKRHLAL
jgi:hypothetical protein